MSQYLQLVLLTGSHKAAAHHQLIYHWGHWAGWVDFDLHNGLFILWKIGRQKGKLWSSCPVCWDLCELHIPFLGAGKSCHVPSFEHKESQGFFSGRYGFAFSNYFAVSFFSIFYTRKAWAEFSYLPSHHNSLPRLFLSWIILCMFSPVQVLFSASFNTGLCCPFPDISIFWEQIQDLNASYMHFYQDNETFTVFCSISSSRYSSNFFIFLAGSVH